MDALWLLLWMAALVMAVLYMVLAMCVVVVPVLVYELFCIIRRSSQGAKAPRLGG